MAQPVTDLIPDDSPEDAAHYGAPEVQVALLNQYASRQEYGRARERDAHGPEHHAEEDDQIPVVLDQGIEFFHDRRSIRTTAAALEAPGDADSVMSRTKFRDTVHHLVEMLVASDFDGLEEASRGRRLTADQLRQAVEEYGRELRMPPEAIFDDLEVHGIEGSIPRAWWTLVDLWTVEEGRSDLTLEIRLTEARGNLYDIEIQNLHVL